MGGDSAQHPLRGCDQWQGYPAGEPCFYDLFNDMTTFDDGTGPSIVACGFFSFAGDTVVRFTGSGWAVLPGFDLLFWGGDVQALEVWNDGNGEVLYVAGSFSRFGDLVANGIIRRDGTTASTLEGPSDVGLQGIESVSDMIVFDDGVEFASPMVPGFTFQVEVRSSADAVLDAWIDFNADGDWDDPSERIFNHRAVSSGTNLLTAVVPPTAVVGATTVARFRLSSTGADTPTGDAPDGEVEDYEIVISVNPARRSGGRRSP